MNPPKRIVVLSSVEYGLAFNGMLHFRNKLVQQGRYTDAVDELLIKLQKTRRCRHGLDCSVAERLHRHTPI